MVEANLDEDDRVRRRSLASKSRGEEQERSRADFIIVSKHTPMPESHGSHTQMLD
jgi:hypothetical protein